MPRPPRSIFQRIGNFLKSTKEKTSKSISKYFLFAFVLIELLSFGVEYLNPKLYEEIFFNLFVNSLFVVLFLFIATKLKFCLRNKIIIYVLIAYYLLNAVLPFFISNLQYENIIKNASIILLSILLIITLWKNTGTK